MKTIKIIDLLNKIANGEEVPSKFIYNGCLYENYQDGRYKHYDYDGRYINIEKFVNKLCDDFCNLNDEVEIIEEDKKIPKKLSILQFSDLIDMSNDEIMQVIKDQRFKINEIIDYLKSKGE